MVPFMHQAGPRHYAFVTLVSWTWRLCVSRSKEKEVLEVTSFRNRRHFICDRSAFNWWVLGGVHILESGLISLWFNGIARVNSGIVGFHKKSGIRLKGIDASSLGKDIRLETLVTLYKVLMVNR